MHFMADIASNSLYYIKTLYLINCMHMDYMLVDMWVVLLVD